MRFPITPVGPYKTRRLFPFSPVAARYVGPTIKAHCVYGQSRGADDLRHRSGKGVFRHSHCDTVALTAGAVGMRDTRQVMFMFSPLRAVMAGAPLEALMTAAGAECRDGSRPGATDGGGMRWCRGSEMDRAGWR